MRKVDRDIDRILSRLRKAIRERGYTQLEVQEVLGWGRSYISQILNREKNLRLDQVLMILKVINVKPEDFWGEIYQFGETYRPDQPGRQAAPALPEAPDESTMADDLRRSKRLLDGVVTVLTQKRLITADDLDEATRRFRPDAP